MNADWKPGLPDKYGDYLFRGITTQKYQNVWDGLLKVLKGANGTMYVLGSQFLYPSEVGECYHLDVTDVMKAAPRTEKERS